MRVRVITLALILMTGVTVVGVRATEYATPLQLSCRSHDDGFALAVLGKVRQAVSSPRGERLRAVLSLPVMSPDSVHIVSADTTACRKAIKLIADYEKLDPANIRPVLVRAGSIYWAEDPSLRAGEYTLMFIMDSALTRVTNDY